MDVKVAYLNGKLKEEIYMEAPPGLEIPEGMVLQLNQAVYGTKQGGRVWYKDVCRTMAEMGYTRIKAVLCSWALGLYFLSFLDQYVLIRSHDLDSHD